MSGFLDFLTSRILAVLAIGWGGLFLYLGATKNLLFFLHPSFRPWVLTASVGLLVFGIREAIKPSHSCCEHAPSSKVMLLSLLAMSVIFFCPKQTLSWKALAKRGPVGWVGYKTIEQSLSQVPKEADAPVDLMLLSSAVINPAVRTLFDEKSVSVIGQLASNENGPHLSRQYLWCCAADARAIQIPLSDLPTPTLPFETWVEVKGVVEIRGYSVLPLIHVKEMRQIPVPEDPYGY